MARENVPAPPPVAVDVRDAPEDVALLRTGLRKAFDTLCENGERVGACKHGVYAFYDYDGEPIYVGRTWESLRQRIGRHLTNQRTDAVAMSVLDPFEVAEVEMWPFWHLANVKPMDAKETISCAEYTVFCQAVKASHFGKVLNEVVPEQAELIDLPPSIRRYILPKKVRRRREHPDVRIARRARTIANLARVISEREVKVGLRRTLIAQAQRLERLASQRLEALTP